MDGLMFDTERVASLMWEEVLKEHNLVVNKNFLIKIKGRNTLDSSHLFRKYYKTNLDFFKLKEEKQIKQLAYIKENGLILKDGLTNLLSFLKNNDYKMALATSSKKEVAYYYLSLSNLRSYFDLIISGDDFKESKPNPEIFIKTARLLGLNKNELLVLEDSYAGVLASINAKIKCIYIPDLVNFKINHKLVFKQNNLNEVIELLR